MHARVRTHSSIGMRGWWLARLALVAVVVLAGVRRAAGTGECVHTSAKGYQYDLSALKSTAGVCSRGRAPAPVLGSGRWSAAQI